MKIAVIGAGPTGLTIANELCNNNIEVDIFETGNSVGGFAKTIEMWGKRVEIGPHFLSIGRLPGVEKLIKDTLRGNYSTYTRKTFILTKNKSFNYPPSVTDIARNLNFFELGALALSFLNRKKAKKEQDGTAEKFVQLHLGEYLYKYFFENFSFKLWGVSGKQISDHFAKSLLGFSSGFSPIKVLYNQVFKTRKSTDIYIYPNGGLSNLWDGMKLNIEKQGGRILFATQIESVSGAYSNSGLLTHITLADGKMLEYDHFIFTIPIEQIIKLLPKAEPAIVLPTVRFRADVLLYLKVTYDKATDGQCFYVYEKGNAITRITNFNKFNEQADNDFTVLLLEFWCSTTDDIWNAEKDELLNIARIELEKTKVFQGLKIIDADIKKVPRAFQVPDMGYLDNKGQLFDQLSPWQNLVVTGRTASVNFNYGMENAIDDGLSIACDLMFNNQHKLNTEKI